MSSPTFLYSTEEPELADAVQVDDVVILGGDEGRHAATVQRIKAGEVIDLVNGRGVRLQATVQEAGKNQLTCLVNQRTQEPASGQAVVLVQALAKGGRDEQAIEAAVEVGVDGVIAWQAERSVSVWRADRIAKGLARWEHTIAAAVKQSRRAWLPNVTGPLGTAELAEVTKQVTASGGAVIVLHEAGTMPFASAQLPSATTSASAQQLAPQILVVVGPEGGISAQEIEMLTAAGAQVAKLGPHVMRTSTAGPVAVSLLCQHVGRWN